MKITHASLFSGIGGFDLAAEHCGMVNILHCEWNPFGRRILNYYWPKAYSYEDITQTDFTVHRGTIDCLSGGFPCQPYSVAGKRLGKADERHLWPQMLRAIREIQPGYIVGENVHGLVNWSRGLVFDEVQADLENEGYEVIPVILPAAGRNAPHKRYRVFFVAYNATYAHNARTNNGMRTDGHGAKNDNGRGEQSFAEHRQNGSNGPTADPSRVGHRGWNIRPATDQPKEQPLHSHIGYHGDGIWRETPRCGANVANPADARTESLQQRRENGICEFGNASDTDSGRFAREEHGQTQAEWFAENGVLGDWSDFPTQSPVCSRNDGFSAQLDCITVPKWTNESIKAYGNAVVPQVVIPIFNVITAHIETFM